MRKGDPRDLGPSGGSISLDEKSAHHLGDLLDGRAVLSSEALCASHRRVAVGGETDALFQMMEYKLLKVIMNPAMIATWVFGLALVATPGAVDWGALWPYMKAVCVIAMTWFHMWLAARRKEFVAGENHRSGRTYRIMNEVPTVLLLVIVISVVVKPF